MQSPIMYMVNRGNTSAVVVTISHVLIRGIGSLDKTSVHCIEGLTTVLLSVTT